MKHRPVTVLNVGLDSHVRHEVGRLVLQNRRILFEYDPAFLGTGLQISPFRLPARPGVVVADPTPFDGLFGVFNDSLPDGWGRLLLDRAVEKLGIERRALTPLDRLAHVGRDGMGALTYEPDFGTRHDTPGVVDLDGIARDAATVLAGEQGPVIEELRKLDGGSAGARPKIAVQVSADRRRIVHGPEALPSGYAHWLIKFPAAYDDASIGAMEHAYHRMAAAAGILTPETHLFGTASRRYFGSRRFDRDRDRRIHMHSLSGLLHADHRAPTLDYDDLLTATWMLTRDAMDVERAFRLACFNVLAHNRDDHAKNVSYLLDDATGGWTLAPAYDLTFSSGPGGEQSMLVMGEGRSPGLVQLHALARKHTIGQSAAIVDQVAAAVAAWVEHADAAGLPQRAAKLIGQKIAPSAAKAPKSGTPVRTTSKAPPRKRR